SPKKNKPKPHFGPGEGELTAGLWRAFQLFVGSRGVIGQNTDSGNVGLSLGDGVSGLLSNAYALSHPGQNKGGNNTLNLGNGPSHPGPNQMQPPGPQNQAAPPANGNPIYVVAISDSDRSLMKNEVDRLNENLGGDPTFVIIVYSSLPNLQNQLA